MVIIGIDAIRAACEHGWQRVPCWHLTNHLIFMLFIQPINNCISDIIYIHAAGLRVVQFEYVSVLADSRFNDVIIYTNSTHS